MSDKYLEQLPEVTDVLDPDLYYVRRAGSSYKITAANLRLGLASAGGAGVLARVGDEEAVAIPHDVETVFKGTTELTVEHNDGSAFVPGTGQFTVPATGLYLMEFEATWSVAGTGRASVRFVSVIGGVLDSQFGVAKTNAPHFQTNWTIRLTTARRLTASTVVQCRLIWADNADDIALNPFSFLSIHRIG